MLASSCIQSKRVAEEAKGEAKTRWGTEGVDLKCRAAEGGRMERRRGREWERRRGWEGERRRAKKAKGSWREAFDSSGLVSAPVHSLCAPNRRKNNRCKSNRRKSNRRKGNRRKSNRRKCPCQPPNPRHPHPTPHRRSLLKLVSGEARTKMGYMG